MTIMPFTIIFLVAALSMALLDSEILVAVMLVLSFVNETLAIWARRGTSES